MGWQSNIFTMLSLDLTYRKDLRRRGWRFLWDYLRPLLWGRWQLGWQDWTSCLPTPLLGSVEGNSLRLTMGTSYPWEEARVHHQTGLCSLPFSKPAAWLLDLNFWELGNQLQRKWARCQCCLVTGLPFYQPITSSQKAHRSKTVLGYPCYSPGEGHFNPTILKPLETNAK